MCFKETHPSRQECVKTTLNIFEFSKFFLNNEKNKEVPCTVFIQYKNLQFKM